MGSDVEFITAVYLSMQIDTTWQQNTRRALGMKFIGPGGPNVALTAPHYARW